MAHSDGGQSSGPFPPIIQAGAIVFVLLLSTSLVLSVVPTVAGTIGGDAVISESERAGDEIDDGERRQTNNMALLLIDLAPFLMVIFGVIGAIAVGSTTAEQPRPVAISVGVGMLLGGVCFVMVVTGLANLQYEPGPWGVYPRTLRNQLVDYGEPLWYKPIGALKSGLTVSVPTALGGGAIAGAIRTLRD